MLFFKNIYNCWLGTDKIKIIIKMKCMFAINNCLANYARLLLCHHKEFEINTFHVFTYEEKVIPFAY